jgi:hypothetical protein
MSRVASCSRCGVQHSIPAAWRPTLCIQALQEDRNHWKRAYYDQRRDNQTEDDLRMVVRDQRSHIANLEAELLPHLLQQPQGEQETFL